MPVTIDEVTAEIAPAESAAPAPPPASGQASAATELRKHRDRAARLQQRAARVAAD